MVDFEPFVGPAGQLLDKILLAANFDPEKDVYITNSVFRMPPGDDGKQFRDMVGNLQTVLFDKGLDQGMEYEADESGMDVAYRTGYDPNGLIRVLKMLQKKEATATSKGSWFSTHPPLSSRLEKCNELKKKYPDADQMATVKSRFQSYVNML